MQTNYSQKNIDKVLKGEKWVNSGSINCKGKPKWSASINQMTVNIFRNLNNDEIALDQLEKGTTVKEDIMERLLQDDEIIAYGFCHKESKVSRVKFRLETLDAYTKCSGCKKNMPVTKWKCKCNQYWHECEQHCRAGKFSKGSMTKRSSLKKKTLNLQETPRKCKSNSKWN